MFILCAFSLSFYCVIFCDVSFTSSESVKGFACSFGAITRSVIYYKNNIVPANLIIIIIKLKNMHDKYIVNPFPKSCRGCQTESSVWQVMCFPSLSSTCLQQCVQMSQLHTFECNEHAKVKRCVHMICQ